MSEDLIDALPLCLPRVSRPEAGVTSRRASPVCYKEAEDMAWPHSYAVSSGRPCLRTYSRSKSVWHSHPNSSHTLCGPSLIEVLCVKTHHSMYTTIRRYFGRADPAIAKNHASKCLSPLAQWHWAPSELIDIQT